MHYFNFLTLVICAIYKNIYPIENANTRYVKVYCVFMCACVLKIVSTKISEYHNNCLTKPLVKWISQSFKINFIKILFKESLFLKGSNKKESKFEKYNHLSPSIRILSSYRVNTRHELLKLETPCSFCMDELDSSKNGRH